MINTHRKFFLYLNQLGPIIHVLYRALNPEMLDKSMENSKHEMR